MHLYEYEAKRLLKKYGIAVPQSKLIKKIDELDGIDIPFPWVMKAQVLEGGRGKKGYVKFAHDMKDAREIFNNLKKISKKILVEEMMEGEEFYISFMIDRMRREYLLMYGEGGVNVEEMELKRTYINPLIGFRKYHLPALYEFASKLYMLFRKENMLMVEINPFVIRDEPVALDAKMIVDDNYSKKLRNLTRAERFARKNGISMVELDGEVAVLANGAGLAMATMDALAFNGISTGAFIDLTGADDAERIAKALMAIDMIDVRAVLINIFGSITRCDAVADGIIKYVKSRKKNAEIVARLTGRGERKARNMLEDIAKITPDFEEAIALVGEVIK